MICVEIRVSEAFFDGIALLRVDCRGSALEIGARSDRLSLTGQGLGQKVNSHGTGIWVQGGEFPLLPEGHISYVVLRSAGCDCVKLFNRGRAQYVEDPRELVVAADQLGDLWPRQGTGNSLILSREERPARKHLCQNTSHGPYVETLSSAASWGHE